MTTRRAFLAGLGAGVAAAAVGVPAIAKQVAPTLSFDCPTSWGGPVAGQIWWGMDVAKPGDLVAGRTFCMVYDGVRWVIIGEEDA